LELFDHSDIPHFYEAIAITRDKKVSLKVELYRVDSVGVAVERLSAEVGSDIPDGDSLVSCSRGKVV
jgi:hypothetical protein